MDSKILGIPVILILLVVFIALLVDLPMVGLHTADQARLSDIQTQVSSSNTKLDVLLAPTATPTATLTPTPTPSLKRVVVVTPVLPTK